MIADGLTKALPQQHHEIFMKMISLEDISARIQIKKQMKAIRKKIRGSNIIIKRDLSKAYDSISWLSLNKILRKFLFYIIIL